MFSRSVPFAVVLAGAFVATAAGQDAVTIKVRKEQKGDKVEVAKTRTGTMTLTAGGKSQTKKDEYRYEYTETVIEMPEGADKPTRADRTYDIARKTNDMGELKTLSFSGKTVEIKVSPMAGIGYIFIVGGNAIQPPEVDDFNYEFQGGPKPGDKKPKPSLDVLLPKTPVKLNEEWKGDLAAIFAVVGDLPFTLDKKASKVTGKLVKTYEKDGAKWGVIELKIVMALLPAATGPEVSGTITADVTLDIVIDGSSRARTAKINGKGTLTVAEMKGADVKVEMNIKQEETVTPVK